MGYRLLLDENVEHEVGAILQRRGHDVEHVDAVLVLGKGSEDGAIGRYSLERERVIVTYDDDFVLDVAPETYEAALYVPDAGHPPEALADAIDAIANLYPQSELRGIEYVGDAWF